MSLRVVGALLLAGFASSALAVCERKEYAQLKDEATQPLGQMSLAFEICNAKTAYEGAKKEFDVAMQYKALRDADRASKRMDACEASRSAVSNALIAAKGHKALAFAQGGCQGQYPAK